MDLFAFGPLSGRLWAVRTGRINVKKDACRRAVVYCIGLDGIVAAYPNYSDSLWFFDSEDAARRGRKLMERKGIVCDERIYRYTVVEDGAGELRVEVKA